jgi:hypothetical protein
MNGIPKVAVAPDKVTVQPGAGTEVEVTIQNTGRSVEHYDTTVVGLPRDDLFGCVPPTVKLRPGESGTVRVTLSIPERPAPDAGLYTLGVLVRSPYQKQVSRCEELRLDVQPAPGVSIAAAPEVVTGGGSARYALQLTNDGNTPLDVTLHGTDPEGAVGFSFRPRSVRVAPNASAPAQLSVRAMAPWSGQEARRTLTVRATATGDLTTEKQLTFVQRPRIPSGPMRFVGIALAVGVLAAATLAGALVRNASSNAKPGAGAAATGPAFGPPLQVVGTSAAPASSPAGAASNPAAGASSSAPAPVPSGAVVLDPAQPPDGQPPKDRPIAGDLWAAQGVKLSVNLEHAPPACADATGLALRKSATYGVFLTSATSAGTDKCNSLPIRFTFAKPVKAVHVTFVGTGGAFQLLTQDTNGTIAPQPAVTPAVKAQGQLDYTGPPVVAVQFGPVSADPNSPDRTIISRVVIEPA